MYTSKGTHETGSRAEWDAVTPNILEVMPDRIRLSSAHFGPFVIVRPHIFGKSGGKGRPKRIASLPFQHWDTPKNEYEKVPMSQPRDIRGGRPQAISIYIRILAGQPKYEVPFPANSNLSAASRR